MTVAIEVSKYYGLAIMDVALYSLLMLWMSGQVIKARKLYKVPLPTPYEMKDYSDFNRYQRAHANSVEGVATYFSTLLLSALGTPIMSGIAGFIFIIGRYLYCLGYYEATKKRTSAAPLYFGAQLYLTISSLYFGAKLLLS